MQDDWNYFIGFASGITISVGSFLLIMLICRRYLYAIFEYIDGLLTADNFMQKLSIFQVPKERLFYDISKRIFDIIYSFIAILSSFPILLFIAFLVKISFSGPIFVKQKRIGRGGKVFYAYKFRTMVAFSQEDNLLKEVWFNNIDNRNTSVGRFLRKTSFDEFPKFFNVLKGDMSIVGTSGATDYSYIETLNDEMAEAILSVKPGLVSLWTLSGRRMRKDLSSRLAYDLYYIANQSFILDVTLFLMILPSLLGRAVYETPKMQVGP